MAPRLSTLFLLIASASHGGTALVFDRTHESEILRETRNFRIFLPSDYGGSGKRYPVVYWFHGNAERHNRTLPNRNYDSGSDYGGDTIEAYVSTHDLIVVKLDGYNPRTPGEQYPHPWNIGPVETDRQFPFYFTELVAYIDASYRTIADRNHRATAGFSMGGFMSFWIAGKYPHLVSSASSFMGSSEFFVGPRGFDVEYRHDEMSANYDGVRTRLVTGARDFIQFYHRRMNALWLFTAPNHETEDVDFGSRHAWHRENPGLSHARLRQSAPQTGDLEPQRRLSVLRRLGMERRLEPSQPRESPSSKTYRNPVFVRACASGFPVARCCRRSSFRSRPTACTPRAACRP